MKFWLLTTEYPPIHGGGISTYCHFTSQMLSESGYEVTVFLSDHGIKDYLLQKESPGITLVRFNPDRSGLHSSLGYTARLSYAFAEMVRLMAEKSGKPDIVEAQDYLGIAYYLTQFKHLEYEFIKGVPIVLTLHSPAFIYLEYNKVPTWRFPDFWTGEMEKQAMKAADLLISPTRFLAEEISRYIDLGDKKVHILANPYQHPNNQSPAAPGTTGEKIVYYGKLSPQKGSFELLSYFRDMWDEGFPYPLHIVGGTDIVYHPEMQTMGQLVTRDYQSYIDKGLLQLHGKIRPDQLHQYLGDADIVLVPSIVDNLPYVVMETMSMGKIVLASIQGGQREMIEDGHSGFLFDHSEPGSFAEKLKAILSKEKAERLRIGKNARIACQNSYSFETIAPQKLSLLQNLLRQPPDDTRFPFLYQQPITPTPALQARKGLLSVVVPYYNMGDYIEECVQSIMDSTYNPIEILIINDGSTNSESIQKLQNTTWPANVRIIHNRNQGLATTRNAGAMLAQGEFLAFLDADDKVLPTYYEKAVSILKHKSNLFFIGSWVRYFGDSSLVWPTFPPQPPYILVHNSMNSSGLVYKRAAFLAGGLNDKKLVFGLEDYDSVVNMMANGFNGTILPEILFCYRVRAASMFRNINTEKLLFSNKYIAEKHSNYYANFAVQVISLLTANGPGYLFDNPTIEVKVITRTVGQSIFLQKLKSLVKKNQRLKQIVLSLKKIKH